MITDGTGGSSMIYPQPKKISAHVRKWEADTAADVNRRIATVDESLNIIRRSRKMLNAVVSIVVREINRLRHVGPYADRKQGGAFFEPIEAQYADGNG